MTAISVVGLGKLGSPIAAVLAASDFHVWGLDISADAVAKLASGIAPVAEPHLQELINENCSRLNATTDWGVAIGETDVTYLIVPTPSGADGAFKNDYLLSAIDSVGNVLRGKRKYHLVVVNSTVMPGSTGGPIRDHLEQVSGKRVGIDIGLCYNPEFIALGDVVNGLLRPDFVLIGQSDDFAGEMLEGIYRRVVGNTVPVSRMNFVNAELTKIALNTFVTTKISYANMLGEICERLPGADADVVSAALGQDTRIGSKYLRGATGYGGPCFPRDTIAFSTMARGLGLEADLAEATHVVNERQLDRLQGILMERTRAGDRIAILGLSYKPDTAVIERAQGLMLAAVLEKSDREVIVHDPLAMEAARAVLGRKVLYADSAIEALAGANAAVVMVPCTEYKELFGGSFDPGETRVILDCWRLLDRQLLSDRLHVIQLGLNETFRLDIDKESLVATGN